MVTLSTAARNALCNTLVDLVDGGTTNPNGELLITTSAPVTLVTLQMSNPAFGAATAGVATANAITSNTASVAGTAALAVINDRDGTAVMSAISVGTSGAEINFNSVAFQVGDNVSISALTVTQPAS